MLKILLDWTLNFHLNFFYLLFLFILAGEHCNAFKSTYKYNHYILYYFFTCSSLDNKYLLSAYAQRQAQITHTQREVNVLLGCTFLRSAAQLLIAVVLHNLHFALTH